MGIKCDTSSFLRQLEESKRKVMKEVENAFIRAGERAVERARDTKTYKDVTGNLSASIGYGVVRDGELLKYGGFGNGEGGEKGKDCLNYVVSSLNTGLALVIVAGMEYAVYVERKGYVVLDGGTLDVGDDIRSQLERIAL